MTVNNPAAVVQAIEGFGDARDFIAALVRLLYGAPDVTPESIEKALELEGKSPAIIETHFSFPGYVALLAPTPDGVASLYLYDHQEKVSVGEPVMGYTDLRSINATPSPRALEGTTRLQVVRVVPGHAPAEPETITLAEFVEEWRDDIKAGDEGELMRTLGDGQAYALTIADPAMVLTVRLDPIDVQRAEDAERFDAPDAADTSDANDTGSGDAGDTDEEPSAEDDADQGDDGDKADAA